MGNGAWTKNNIIELDQVSKKYQMGEVCVTALDGISLHITGGEFLVVLGLSGSGKTTLLNLISALDTATSGSFCMDGQDITHMNHAQRTRYRRTTVSFVFQSFNLFPALTALKHAGERIQHQLLSHKVTLVQADIHAQDFPAETFDVVIAESVLVFCDKPRAAAEVYRVLKRGGVFGDNEFTFLRQPPPEWKTLLSSAYFGLDIQPLLSEEWQGLFEKAGFVNLSAISAWMAGANTLPQSCEV